LKLQLAWLRSQLDLPPPRCATQAAASWMALSDGTRLATRLVQPTASTGAPSASILIRTPNSIQALPLRLAAELLAQQGYSVAVQTCRGRYESEGRFEPFAHEARDGAEALRWLAAQPGFAARPALLGLGYSGFAAWAACAAAAGETGPLVVGFAARDPYAWLHAGGALRLRLALTLSVGLGERAFPPARQLDLARALRFRPLCDADRVALRRCDAYRSWIEHPERDAFWEALCPALPETLPAVMNLAGWREASLAAQLADHTAVAARAASAGGTAPELVIGPWSSVAAARRPLSRATPIRALGCVLAFLDRHMRGVSASAAPVRIHLGGAAPWRDLATWPPPGTRELALHLRSGGDANGGAGDGLLCTAAPPDHERPDRFVYDPADAVPSRNDAAAARAVEQRSDVLAYRGEVLREALELTGPVALVLFAASDAPRTDFTASLLRVDQAGMSTLICDGILRCGEPTENTWLEPGRALRLVLDLGAAGLRLRAGESLRLEVSSSCFPRFDRHANTREHPALVPVAEIRIARQAIFHDAQRPSQLRLCVASERPRAHHARRARRFAPAGPSTLPREQGS
jgi:uncharacterized protein